jgi:4-hydroxy-3-polyprenylbenzoate decarboxylase
MVQSSDLAGFAERLDTRGELRRIAVEVDPFQELAEITSRVTAAEGGGPALLFERVAGSSFPLVANIFGSSRRMAMALGLTDLMDLRDVGEKLCEDPNCLDPFAPRLVAKPVCQEVAEEPDLSRIPFIRCWKGDGSSAVDGYLTLPLVISRDPDSGEQNCGMYRASRQGLNRLGLAWRSSSGAARHADAYRRRGEPMPVAVVLGGPPALIYAATVPFPPEIDEMAFAGLLAGEPLAVARTDAGGLLVPAGADVVLEGYVYPGDQGDEGRFGNHTGRYVSAGGVPVMTVTRITRCRDPLVPVTAVGLPPTENRWFARATERLMLPFLRALFPDISDCTFIPGGEYHGASVVALGQGERSSAVQMARELRRTSWLAGSSLLVFVDDDQDCRDTGSLFWRLLNRRDWPADMERLAPEDGAPRGCLVVDGRRTAAERADEISRSSATVHLVDRRWPEYGIDGQDRS